MANPTGKVTSSGLNLRRDASTTHPPIVSLARGTEVEVLAQEGSWYRVRYAGQEGYVGSRYLAVQEAPPLPRPTPVGPPPVAAAPHFLLARPELQRIRLEPATPIPVTADMPATTRSAARTWNSFGGLLGAMSEIIGVPSAAAVSVLCVESGGAGFKGERLIIRFENHVLFNLWGKHHPETFAQHFAFNPQQKWKDHAFRASPSEPWAGFHGSQEKEWRVFEYARGLDEAAAMSSISMGAPQIMGFNFKRIGYTSVQDMFAAFSRDVRYHILGMFDFIQADASMVAALRREDYERFATGYNGSGQAQKYGLLIRQHCDASTPFLTQSTPRLA